MAFDEQYEFTSTTAWINEALPPAAFFAT